MQLIAIECAVPSISGGPEVNFIHQSTLDDTLDAYVRVYPAVQIYLGYEVKNYLRHRIWQTIDVWHFSPGKCRAISAGYVLGCDGANSYHPVG